MRGQLVRRANDPTNTPVCVKSGRNSTGKPRITKESRRDSARHTQHVAYPNSSSIASFFTELAEKNSGFPKSS